MTSTASSVQTATSSFNSDFYVAISAAIPVLFLALAVQTPTFVRVFRAYQGVGRRPTDEQNWLVSGMFTVASVLVLLGFFGGTVIALLGEGLTVYVLYQRQGQSWVGPVVLWSAVFLIIAVGLVTMAAFMGGIVGTSAQNADATLDTNAQLREEESTPEDTESVVRKVDTT